MKKVSDRLSRGNEKSVHVAMAYKNGTVIGVATNSPVHGHAEERLIRKLRRSDKVGRIDILVVRVANTSTCGNVVLKNSRPCVHCRRALLESELKYRYIMWSTEDDTIVAVRPSSF